MKTWSIVGITLIIWSSAYAGIREGLLGGYSPEHLVLFRYIIASAVFVLYALLPGTRIRVPAKRDLPGIFGTGVIGISGHHLALAYGEQTVTAGTAGLLIGAAPMFTAVIAAFVLKEKLKPVGWLGLAIGFVGIALIALGADGGTLRISAGGLLILLAAVATALFLVLQKPYLARYGAVEATAWFTWAGTLPLLVFSPGMTETLMTATPAATASVIYLGIFPAAIAYAAWAVVLAASNASTLTSTMYLSPVLSILIAWIWLRELPSLLSVIGGVIAIVSVVVVNGWGTGQAGPEERTKRKTVKAKPGAKAEQA
jgi:drug/metabolite transporter (DMT)-like permease